MTHRPRDDGGPTTTPSRHRGAPAAEPSSQLVQLTLTRFREFAREPEAVFWTFVFPLLLATGLGIAFRSRPPEAVKVGVVRTAPNASDIQRTLAADRGLSSELMTDSAAARALRIGSIALAVVPRSADSVDFRYDDARAESRAARLVVDGALQRAAGRRDPVAVGESLVRERGSRYIDFLLPGLLAMNLMGGGVWGIGFGIVDARRKKLLKRLIATPMSRAKYLLSFLLMRLTMTVVEVTVVVAFGVVAFGVPMRGSLLVFALIAFLTTLMFGAIGLLIASRARTMEGASGLMNVVMLPMWVGSGVFFAAGKFPAAVQPIIQALPLTAAVDAMRINMLQGGGIAALSGELAIISIWLLLCFVIALKLFRWQ